MPAFVAAIKLGFALATALLMISSVIFALVWIPRRLFGDLKGAPLLKIRTYPLLATLFAAAVFVLIWDASGDAYGPRGGPGRGPAPWSR